MCFCHLVPKLDLEPLSDWKLGGKEITILTLHWESMHLCVKWNISHLCPGLVRGRRAGRWGWGKQWWSCLGKMFHSLWRISCLEKYAYILKIWRKIKKIGGVRTLRTLTFRMYDMFHSLWRWLFAKLKGNRDVLSFAHPTFANRETLDLQSSYSSSSSTSSSCFFTLRCNGAQGLQVAEL